MKYNILIKYINSIPSATKENGIDISRLLLLCEKLGRVNVGAGYIYTSGGAYAHASGTVLESVMKASGYTVARITDAYGFDIKRSIYVDGVSPSIEEFTNILTYIRDILKKNKTVTFLREEVVFAICLYVSKILGAKYVILENTREDTKGMFEICAPFNFAIVPKLYGTVSQDELDRVASCINLVNRGVVTGNNQHYNYLSDKCHKAGIRLLIHRTTRVVEEKMRQQTFVYNEKQYTLRSASPLLRDATVSVFELAELMKDHRIKISSAAISGGIGSVGNCGCFEVLSLSPMIISDISSSCGQLELAYEKLCEYSQRSNLSGVVAICESDGYADMLKDVFAKEKSLRIIDASSVSYRELAESILTPENREKLTFILGGLEFTEGLGGALKTAMDRI